MHLIVHILAILPFKGFIFWGVARNLRFLPNDMRFCTTSCTLAIDQCEQPDLASRSNQVMKSSLDTLMANVIPHMAALPRWLQGAAQTVGI
ncbi:hypothetical protein TIFTF001_042829 [Ficus carica]|uniref:Uncharacterized protein n=1 Tax=Ficus carica TaxID=3494 RepID=A0AA88CH09_FICCA|nr:hypothetical protein TIFTF001_042824 [Ficus carica]GMN19181.1 hypothetical protein TIFTF001_042829 [Ficus carica]